MQRLYGEFRDIQSSHIWLDRVGSLSKVLCGSVLFWTGAAVAAEGGSAHGGKLDFFGSLAGTLGITEEFLPLLSSGLTVILTAFVGLYFKASLGRAKDLAPPSHFSLRAVMEWVMEFLHDMTKEQCGSIFRSVFPLIAGLFVFILITNLVGLIPGLPPSTENFSANLGLSLIVFLCYNYLGLKEHGVAYAKQFMGPFLIMAPFFIPLELISHAARPMSLALRLTVNIFGDHLLLGVFSAITPLLVPAVLLLFGLLVASIQSFVFAMLTSIYINMAISHDH